MDFVGSVVASVLDLGSPVGTPVAYHNEVVVEIQLVLQI